MKRRELLVGLAAAAIAEGCASHPPGSVQQGQAQESQARYTNQIALLQAVVRGLAAVPVGSLDGPRAARTLALPPGQAVVYLIPVGLAA